MKKPTFLLCGGCASGCSQLTAAMKQHPDIFLPTNHRPEPHFFYYSDEFAKGFRYYLDKYFQETGENKAIGETSSSYMLGDDVPVRIAQYLPDIKLIFQIRNPIERAYAGYRATAFHGLETLSFDDALIHESEREKKLTGRWKEVRPFAYIGRSLYAKKILNFRKHFPDNQILILKSEDTRKNPQKSFERVFDFIEVDSKFKPVLPPSYTNRSVIDLDLQATIRKKLGESFDQIIDAIEKEANPFHYSKSPDDDHAIKILINNLHSEVQPMSDFSRNFLIEKLRSDIIEVSKLVDFKVDDWL